MVFIDPGQGLLKIILRGKDEDYEVIKYEWDNLPDINVYQCGQLSEKIIYYTNTDNNTTPPNITIQTLVEEYNLTKHREYL